MYDVIYIDEVQDLCGYDLELLKLLAGCGMPIKMVGDVRQAVIATNPQEPKNKKYMFMGIWSWFQEEAKAGRIQIVQRCETWRCRPEIASFADSLFGAKWGFNASISLNQSTTAHDGLFLIKLADLPKYMETFKPMLLRHSANSGKTLPYSFLNYKESKGLSVGRVCILPTDPIKKYLGGKGALKDQQAAELYVAVTRAEQSVGFIVDDAGLCDIPFWIPPQ
jgi:superfamily I DNA/RNA helicase